MTLRIHDTATRSLRDFEPLEPGKVSVYVCGATVQGAPHIGHARSAVCFDILHRWLEHEDYDVTLVRNVTDIDDKILAKAAEADTPWWAWAYRFERAFDDAYRALGVHPPTYAPRATGHVPEMITLMRRLVDSGHAYASDGSVYFDVGSFDGYGALSGQSPTEMKPAEDTDPAAGRATKRDPRDFALWKASLPGEPAWDTPWGAGRPGWHLECSVMATRYCGSEFDIHGGGLDLIFPHHENEIAQSRAAGDGFARYWMHNNWVTTAGEKMSKSLGNSLLVSELIKQVRPIELRYYLGSAHYRSVIAYSPQALAESAAGFRRIESFIHRASEAVPAAEQRVIGEAAPTFRDAMNEDLAVPAALAALHETVTEGNTALSNGSPELPRLLGSVRAMAAVLGVDPLAEHWQERSGDDRAFETLDRLVTELLAARARARAERDFAAADSIRDSLSGAGIKVEDSNSGSTWELDQ